MKTTYMQTNKFEYNMSFPLGRVFVTKIAYVNFRANPSLRSGTSRQIKRSLGKKKSKEKFFMSQKENKQIIVVMRGPSAVLFHQERNLIVTDFQSVIGPVNIVYSTRWLKKANDIVLPGNVWIEISGNAPSLEEALVPFANAGLSMLPILSLSTNAAIGEPEIEIGFDNTKGVTERDYFQCYVAPEKNEIHIGRHINIEATISFLNSISRHPDSERLRRAINQYRLALDLWRLGRESLSLAHLWMALEALTKAKIRKECSLRNLSNQQELAENLGVDLKELDPFIRKDFLLKGDGECYTKAKKASDGFEHGFLGYDKIIKLSQDIRSLMAAYIRTAILEMCEIEKETYKTLTTEPFNKPIGYWPVVKYLRGKLIGEGDQLAKEGNAYPFMRWKAIVKSTSIEDGGKFNIKMTDSFTAELAQNIEFQPFSHEAWQVE